MGLVEALVLLSAGFVCGIVATTFDVIFIGSASFLAHITLLVLLTALIAVHVESRTKAIWWAAPFTFGFVESYFLTTVASYEGFSKSMIVPLAALSVVMPLLSYAIWTAKNEKNAYGNILGLLVVGGTLAMSYVVNGRIAVYDIVICVLLAYVLLLMPVRRLKITRVPLKQVQRANAAAAAQEDGAAQGAGEGSVVEAQPARGRRVPTMRSEASAGASADEVVAATEDQKPADKSRDPEAKRSLRPTRRKRVGFLSRARSSQAASSRERAAADDMEARPQEERRRVRGQRRSRGGQQPGYGTPATNHVSTLGNARVARPSTRGRSEA